MRLLSSVRTRLVRLKDAMDARLHPRRRAAALRRLDALRPRSVLFVCLGNVCRSPYAERILREWTEGRLQVASSGFIGPGRAPPDDALAVARERGTDHADHVSRVTTLEMLREADAVFFFDRFNLARLRGAPGVRRDRLFWLGDFDPEWEGKRSIRDPWGKPREEFHRVFARIERSVREVCTVLDGENRA